MHLQAITVDGTVIKAHQFKVGKHGLTLKRRAKGQSGQSKGSGQSQQKSGQSGGGSSEQSGQSGGSSSKSEQSSEDVTVIIDEDVPEEERQELKTEHSQESQSQSGQSGSGGSSSQQSEKSKGSQKYEKIGFVPFERLMYVIPEEVTHNVDQLDRLPA